MASGTSLRHAEEALRLDDLPAAVAGAAGRAPSAVRCTAAFAGITGVEFAEADFLFATVDGFLEGQLHVVAQIGAARRAGGTALTAAAKQILKNAAAAAAEHLPENVERIVKPAAAATGPGTRAERGVAKLVVGRFFLGIAQGLVGFTDFLEFLLGLLVVGILVRMIFDGELAVGFFDFISGGTLADAQHLVVIALGHAYCSLVSSVSPEGAATTTEAARRRRSLSR